MNKRNCMSMVAFSALAGLTLASQSKGISREEAVRIAHGFLAKAKLAANKPLAKANSIRAYPLKWEIEFGLGDYDRMRIFVDRNTGHIPYASTGREAERREGRGRTKKPRFSRDEEARLYTNLLLKQFAGGDTFVLDEFRFRNDKVASGKVVPGEIWARYGRRINGYPIVDRSCYIAFRLDSQDGYLLTYTHANKVPAVSANRSAKVTEKAAWNTFLKNTRSKPQADRYNVTLGYAVPQGESIARLCWRMWEKGKPPYAYFVDASSGKYLGRLGD